jgi:hypothetical protein
VSVYFRPPPRCTLPVADDESLYAVLSLVGLHTMYSTYMQYCLVGILSMQSTPVADLGQLNDVCTLL